MSANAESKMPQHVRRLAIDERHDIRRSREPVSVTQNDAAVERITYLFLDRVG